MRIYIYIIIIVFSSWFGTPKKGPGTHHICRKTMGKMLLGIYLWGPFFGVANHQENYKYTHIMYINVNIYIYVCVCHVLLEFTRRHEHKDPCFLNLVDQQYRNSCLLWWGQQKFTVGIPTYLIYSFRIGMAC